MNISFATLGWFSALLFLPSIKDIVDFFTEDKNDSPDGPAKS